MCLFGNVFLKNLGSFDYVFKIIFKPKKKKIKFFSIFLHFFSKNKNPENFQ